jgi:hypothetical protein
VFGKKIEKLKRYNNAEFHAEFNPLKKFQKNAQKKFSANQWDESEYSESGKCDCAYFLHIFVNNFCVCIFTTVSMVLKSAWNLRFLIPFRRRKKILWGHISSTGDTRRLRKRDSLLTNEGWGGAESYGSEKT